MKDQLIELPFFPLSIILLPGEEVPLHIFEPRYQQLLNDLKQGDTQFGIPYFSKSNTKQIGTLVKLVDITKRYGDGRADIIIEGCGNFQLMEFHQVWNKKQYGGGKIKPIERSNKELPFELIERFWNFLKLSTLDDIELYQLRGKKIEELASTLTLSSEEKLAFLNFPHRTKIKFVENRLQYLSILFEQENNTENNFYLN